MNWIKQLLGGGTVSLSATADHIELADNHLILGLNLNWYNSSNDAIFIHSVRLTVETNGRKQESLLFKTLEHFARVPAQRAFQKTPATQFILRPKETHTEQIRFFGQEVPDLTPGQYRIDVQITDSNNAVYSHQTKIQIETKIKYRLSDEWQTD